MSQLHLNIENDAELQALWSRVLTGAEERVGREALRSWLADTAPVDFDQGRLRLAAPNATARAWIEKKYLTVLRSLFAEAAGREAEIEVVVRKAAPSVKARAAAREAPVEYADRPSNRSGSAVSGFFQPLPLHERYTFENFVVGQSNRFAHAAATSVAERPGGAYNPLFVYGGVGLGKTHLLQAIGHELRRRDPRIRVAYVSGETFTSHFVTSLRERREEEFRRAYRRVDVWLVDDVQFIADKTGTKEEFFHTFNELYLTNRQIVLAADRPPRELRLMEDRLRTRLESGLMAEIVPPELETRIAILQKRALAEGVEIPPEVTHYIATTVSNNIRVLEGALIRTVALASLNRCPITAELAARALGAFAQQDGGLPSVTAKSILAAVSEHFRVAEADLVSARRDRPISLARQVAMYLMRELTRSSLVEIGELFGGKAHSTVLYSCGRLEQAMTEDAGLQGAVRGLRSRLAASGERTSE